MTPGALTREQVGKLCWDIRNCDVLDNQIDDMLTHDAALRATITQQAQELAQAKGNYAIQKAAADDYEQQLAASQARCAKFEAIVRDHQNGACNRTITQLQATLAQYRPICLNCGREKPCMTIDEAAKDGASPPCTFDPTPKQLFEENKYLRATLASREARIHDLERGLAAVLQVLQPFTEAQQARGSSGGAANYGAGT